MNLNFLLAGTTSTNPILYTITIILLFAGSGAYFWGVDRYAIPYVKNMLGKGAYMVEKQTVLMIKLRSSKE